MNKALISAFRKKLEAGPVFGPFMKTSDPAFVEAAGFGGCDFAVLDCEHGPVGIESMQNNVRAAQVSGLFPIIRVPELNENAISKALDIGAGGVQIPQITSADEARRAIAAAKFYPRGERGVCCSVRAAQYGNIPKSEYFGRANETFVILQLEGKKAVENLDAILAVEGIDILFIGPYDLSQSLGVPGEVSNPIVIAEMKKIVAAAAAKHITVGVYTDGDDAIQLWVESGIKYISYLVDVNIFRSAMADAVSRFRGIAGIK